MKDAPSEVGMSRAAKKRAKKRKKQKRNNMAAETEHDEEEKHFGDMEKKQTVKKRKMNKERTSPNAMATLKETDDSHMSVKEESAVSLLTPAQILLLKGIPDEDTALVEELQTMTSSHRARCLMNSLLLNNTMTAQEFYDKYWEKQPLYIPASKRNRFHGLLTVQDIRKVLEKETLCFGRDLNVTKYHDATGSGVKRRVTLDLKSNNDSAEFVEAQAQDVWSNYDSGCTIRLLCPQHFFGGIHSLLSLLELEWGCMVGANAYLTPACSNEETSQGFAPHYDDIEAFILQLEGTKHWKVYAPMNREETLPRTSSEDYVESDLKDPPILDIVLKPGDMLYMPRGWIHQASCTSKHSLHLTVSAMQQWAWADYLEILVPQALEAATATSLSLREGLPRNFLNYMGAIHDDNSDEKDLPEGLKQLAKAQEHATEDDDSEERARTLEKKRMQQQFRDEAKKRIMRVCTEAMTLIDAGCDQIGKRFLSDRLPPALAPHESSMTSESQTTQRKIWPNTLCRLVRPGIARLALEDNKAVLYHCVDNSCVYHGNPLSPMEFEMDDAPALEALLTTVEPHWISVQDLIHDDIKDKMEIAQALHDEGILAIMQAE